MIFDSTSLEMVCCVMHITEEWFDSDSALTYAEANGGKDFRVENPDYSIRASLSQALVPNSYPCWSVIYSTKTDSSKRLSFYFDARENSEPQISFYPEVDTIFLYGGCTTPELSFHLGSIGGAHLISLEPGFNTTVMRVDSSGDFVTVEKSYFLVTGSHEDIEYELKYHPKSYPPFDPVIIELDSTTYIDQHNFEIKLVVKHQGVPVDSLTQFFIADFGLAVKPGNNLPGEFNLYQNYPNPFNPATTIKYSIPIVETHRDLPAGKAGASLLVSLKVYDVIGREVVVLVYEEKHPGNYEINFEASSYNLPSGIYFYQLQAGRYNQTRKMVYLK